MTERHLIVKKKLWPFEVPWCYPYIIFLTRMIEFSQTPVNEPQLTEPAISMNVINKTHFENDLHVYNDDE